MNGPLPENPSHSFVSPAVKKRQTWKGNYGGLSFLAVCKLMHPWVAGVGLAGGLLPVQEGDRRRALVPRMELGHRRTCARAVGWLEWSRWNQGSSYGE